MKGNFKKCGVRLAKAVLTTIGISLVLYSCNTTDPTAVQNLDPDIERKVDALLSQMTLEEKVAQTRIFHANLGIELDENNNLVLSEDVRERLKHGIAGIKNPGEHITPERSAILNNQLQQYITENNRLGIPALFVTESYNGVDAHGCTRFARPIALSASWDTALVNRVFDVMGIEARLRGLHLTHSPVADIARDPRFGRMSEGWGEDTYLSSRMVVSAVKGLQGDYTGLSRTHIGAVTKHFAGYAQVAGGKNFASVEISPRTLIDEIFPPFKAAVREAKTLGIMASHGDLNGVASHANPWLLTEVLREQWGFPGYVVSDANDVGRLHYFMHVAESPESAVELGIKAGVDIDLYADDAYALLPEMAKNDPGLIDYIDQSARRVLRTKYILGLFDLQLVDEKQTREVTRNQAAIELAQLADQESIILLKNENDILPLSANQQLIALVGPTLTDHTMESFRKVTGDRVSYVAEKGYDLTNGKNGVPSLTPEQEIRKGIQKILQTTRNAQTILLFAGGDEFTAKEAFFNGAIGDRDCIEPVGLQDELIAALKQTGKPVIVVLKHRRTLSINAFSEMADAILDCWELSEFGEDAIAKTVFGINVPSGKLQVTVPRNIGQLPIHYSQKEINFKKGYLFSDASPLYPFGFGLSYAAFEYSRPQISDTLLTSSNGKLTIEISVKNTGDVKAKEVVQLYIKDIIGSVVRPVKELKGFQKIELEPGASKTVRFDILPEMLEFSTLSMEQKAENGAFEVQIGGSSADVQSVSFTLKL